MCVDQGAIHPCDKLHFFIEYVIVASVQFSRMLYENRIPSTKKKK